MKTSDGIEHPRNLWPWGIVLTFVIFISGTAGLIVLACQQNSDLVSANYYEDEVRFQTQIDRLQRARNLTSPAEIRYDAARREIIFTLPAEQVRTETHGNIQLYRPSAAGLDRSINLQPDAAGSQSLDAKALLPGLWEVRVLWTVNGLDYRVDQKIIIPGNAS
ncbi:MAG TPA: FixH family protein [Verrucomicrobiae bacterium]